MSRNDLRTEAIVIRRVNFGESDRIINFLTPLGKKSALARGVRKEKSKLAGGIEMFSISEITLHQKSDAPDSLAILTSARTKHFYQNIISSFDRLELGSEILKKVSQAADGFDDPALFKLAQECFMALDADSSNLQLIEAYARFKLAVICGEQINLLTDASGAKLQSDQTYFWDSFSAVLSPNPSGNITSAHIKLMRLILASELRTISRVQGLSGLIPEVLTISKTF